ncbi:MAG: hypothetical protein U0075_19950 [Thermomicrobiales bacterium]
MNSLGADSGAHVGRVPLPRTRLIGRRAELERALGLLLEHATPVLTLTGPGGSGKTRLAQSLAAEFAARAVRDIVWIDFAPLADSSLVPMTVAQALGLTPVPGLAITAQVIAALQPRETLLVLDNCEHVLEQTAELATSLLQVCPGLQLVATSRAPLRLRYERDFPVEPLPLPGVHAAVDVLLQNDAVCLFAERAEAVDARFALDAGNVREVAAICRALDGLPLAIELAAARTRVLSLGVLQHQMSDRLDLLRGGARDLPMRQRTIAGTIAWSYTLLTPTQQASFRRLGVFAGGWSLPAAVAVAADPGGAAHVLDDLTALVDQSLVRRDYESANLRFTMLETIREFALRELTSQGEDVATRTRHAAWYLETVERLNLHHAPQGDSARTHELMTEQDNLRQALAWYAETRDAPALTRLSAALAKFWFDLGQFTEARHWLQLAIADSAGVDLLSRARAFNKAAWLAMCQGDLERASTLRATGLELAREAGDTFLLAESVFEAGILAFWLGNLERATAHIEEAQLTLAAIEAEYATAPIKMCSTLNLLGGIALIAGDVDLSVHRGESAVELARALVATTDLGYALCGLGYARLTSACFQTPLLPGVAAIAWSHQGFAFLARLHWAFRRLPASQADWRPAHRAADLMRGCQGQRPPWRMVPGRPNHASAPTPPRRRPSTAGAGHLAALGKRRRCWRGATSARPTMSGKDALGQAGCSRPGRLTEREPGALHLKRLHRRVAAPSSRRTSQASRSNLHQARRHPRRAVRGARLPFRRRSPMIRIPLSLTDHRNRTSQPKYGNPHTQTRKPHAGGGVTLHRRQ